jgi:hypothetical protein
MRQVQLQKTTRRRSRPTEYGPLETGAAADTSAAQDVLDLIDQILETM